MKQLSPSEIRQMKSAARALSLPIRRAPPIQLLRLALRIGTQVGWQTQFARQTLPHGWVLTKTCFPPARSYNEHSTSCLASAIPCLSSTTVPPNYTLTTLSQVLPRYPNARVAGSYNKSAGQTSAGVAYEWRRGCATTVADITWPVESPLRRKQDVRARPISLPPLAPSLDPNLARAIPRRLNPFGGVDIDLRRQEAEDMERAQSLRAPGRFRVVWPGTRSSRSPRLEYNRGGVGDPRRRLKPGLDAQPVSKPIAPSRPPDATRVREGKADGPRKVADQIWNGLDKLSETCDAIEAIHSALPPEYQAVASTGLEKKVRKAGGQFAIADCEKQALQLWRNWQHLDAAAAVEALIANEIEDKVIGRTMAQLRSAVGPQNAQKLQRILNVQRANVASGLSQGVGSAYNYGRRKASDAWKRFNT